MNALLFFTEWRLWSETVFRFACANSYTVIRWRRKSLYHSKNGNQLLRRRNHADQLSHDRELHPGQLLASVRKNRRGGGRKTSPDQPIHNPHTHNIRAFVMKYKLSQFTSALHINGGYWLYNSLRSIKGLCRWREIHRTDWAPPGRRTAAGRRNLRRTETLLCWRNFEWSQAGFRHVEL